MKFLIFSLLFVPSAYANIFEDIGNFLFPKVEYTHSHSKPILDKIFGINMKDKIPARGKIAVTLDSKNDEGKFDGKFTTTSYLYPASLDTCFLFLDLMTRFYSEKKTDEVKITYVGFKTDVMKTIVSNNKDNSGHTRLSYSKDKELTIVLNKKFLKDNKKFITDKLNYCSAAEVAKLFNGKEIARKQYEDIKNHHLNINININKSERNSESPQGDIKSPSSNTSKTRTLE